MACDGDGAGGAGVRTGWIKNMKTRKHRTVNIKERSAKVEADVMAALPPSPVVVNDLADLESFCAKALEVTVIVRGQPFHCTGRRLKPAEAREIKMILESPIAPVIKEEGQEDRYNYQDEGYRKAREEAWVRARAIAIWRGFPCFREKAMAEALPPGDALRHNVPVKAEEIVAWMGDRQLEDDILEGLFGALTKEEVNSYLGFISGNSSPKS